MNVYANKHIEAFNHLSIIFVWSICLLCILLYLAKLKLRNLLNHELYRQQTWIDYIFNSYNALLILLKGRAIVQSYLVDIWWPFKVCLKLHNYIFTVIRISYRSQRIWLLFIFVLHFISLSNTHGSIYIYIWTADM